MPHYFSTLQQHEIRPIQLTLSFLIFVLRYLLVPFLIQGLLYLLCILHRVIELIQKIDVMLQLEILFVELVQLQQVDWEQIFFYFLGELILIEIFFKFFFIYVEIVGGLFDLGFDLGSLLRVYIWVEQLLYNLVYVVILTFLFVQIFFYLHQLPLKSIVHYIFFLL